MAISTYSLLSREELERAVGGTEVGAEKIEDLALDVLSEIEDFCGRQFVTRGSRTEYHPSSSGQRLGAELYLLEWPIISITDVWEDGSRAYDATSKLTVDTDYILHSGQGKLIRIASASGIEQAWLSSFRAVKVVYSAGYANTAAIPAGLKRIARELAALMWRDRSRSEIGLASRNDGAGNVTRYIPGMLTDQMRRRLTSGGWKRLEPGLTGEVG